MSLIGLQVKLSAAFVSLTTRFKRLIMLIIKYYINKLYIINGFNAFNISVTVRSICMLSVNIGRYKINRDLGMINETYLYMMFGNNLLIQTGVIIKTY